MTGQREQFILVPRNPTPEMLEAAWASALAEDAGGVWLSMIEEFEKSLQLASDTRSQTELVP